MSISTRNYEDETYLTQSYPWGWYVGGAAVCADGKRRVLKRIAQSADSFYSVPAAVGVDGSTVSGFVTVGDRVEFTATGRNAHLIVKA